MTKTTDTSAVATIRRCNYPQEYSGWSVEHGSPEWTSDRLYAAPVPLEILVSELNRIAVSENNIWAVVYPQNIGILNERQTAEIHRIKAELEEMTSRATSLVLHLPPETLVGDLQRWRDEAKLLLANPIKP